MRNDKAFLKILTLGYNLKTGIVIGLCFYVATLSLIALAHDHSAHAHSEEDACTACFYNSQHVGAEVESTGLIFPFPRSTTLPLYEAVFLPLRLYTNTLSRAPPVFSNELSIAVC